MNRRRFLALLGQTSVCPVGDGDLLSALSPPFLPQGPQPARASGHQVHPHQTQPLRGGGLVQVQPEGPALPAHRPQTARARPLPRHQGGLLAGARASPAQPQRDLPVRLHHHEGAPARPDLLPLRHAAVPRPRSGRPPSARPSRPPTTPSTPRTRTKRGPRTPRCSSRPSGITPRS